MTDRREVLKGLAGLSLPGVWIKPVIEVGQLPGFAQISASAGVVQCGQLVSGANEIDERVVELGKTSGTFTITYNTFGVVSDRIIVTYEGTVLLDTGCVTEQKSVTLSFAGSSSWITVRVEPNCENAPLSTWEWIVYC